MMQHLVAVKNKIEKMICMNWYGVISKIYEVKKKQKSICSMTPFVQEREIRKHTYIYLTIQKKLRLNRKQESSSLQGVGCRGIR